MKIRTTLTATNAIITKLKPPAMAPELLLVVLSGFGVLPRGLVVGVRGVVVVGSASTKYAYTYKARPWKSFSGFTYQLILQWD